MTDEVITNQISELLGVTLAAIKHDGNTDELMFYTTDGRLIKFYHHQDCCESVYVESVTGDFADLINSPIQVAEERISYSDEKNDSTTYTFYTFRTIKGSVDVRWVGSSNSYYSESVDMDVTRVHDPVHEFLKLFTDAQKPKVQVWVANEQG